MSRAQLCQAGVPGIGIERALACGALIPIRRGIYRLPGVPVTQQQAWMAAVIAASCDAVLSHGSAAAAWGLRGFDVPDRIDILTTGVRPAVAGVRSHRTVSLPDADRTRLWRIPITTAERTLIDACGLLPFRTFERSVDDALRRRLVHLPRLVRTFEVIPVSGRRRSAPMTKVLAERVPGFRAGGSDAELDVMRILKRAGVRPLPVQQYRVVLEGRTYLLDYAWPETRHALEYDGKPFHSLVSDFHRDRERVRRLQRAGWVHWSVTSTTSPNEIIAVALQASGQTAA